MRLASLRLPVLATAASLLLGCNAASNSGTTITYTTSDLTGDWIYGITDPPSGGPWAITQFAGALSGSGKDITGVFRASSPTGCISPTFDVAFTGSQDVAGNLTLTSTNLPGNVATITQSGFFAPVGGEISSLGGLIITGSGPCVESGIALRGTEVTNVTATYAGSLSTGSGPATPFAVTLAETTANADGQFLTTGAVTVNGTGCTNVFSLNGLVSGTALSANLNLTSGPSATGMLGIASIGSFAQNGQTFSVMIAGAGCNSGSFTGSLTRQ
jgi:hypothetical protein